MPLNIGDKVERALLPIVPLSQKLPARYQLKRLLGTMDPLISRIVGFAAGPGRAVDVGANDGTFTYAFAGVAASVDAFEPQPALARQISCFRGPRQRNVAVHSCGLSNASGTMTLHVPLIAGRFRKAYAVTGLATFRNDTGTIFSNQQLIDVPVKTLDEFHFVDVTLLKIDVEGHEAQVIEGAVETLERCRPVIVLELERRHVGKGRLIDTIVRLQQLGYSGFFFQNDKLVSIDDFDMLKHQAEYADADAMHRAYLAGQYINNFVFKPS